MLCEKRDAIENDVLASPAMHPLCNIHRLIARSQADKMLILGFKQFGHKYCKAYKPCIQQMCTQSKQLHWNDLMKTLHFR